MSDEEPEVGERRRQPVTLLEREFSAIRTLLDSPESCPFNFLSLGLDEERTRLVIVGQMNFSDRRQMIASLPNDQALLMIWRDRLSVSIRDKDTNTFFVAWMPAIANRYDVEMMEEAQRRLSNLFEFHGICMPHSRFSSSDRFIRYFSVLGLMKP